MELTVESITAESKVARRLDVSAIVQRMNGSLLPKDGGRFAVIEQDQPPCIIMAKEDGRVVIGGLRSMNNTRKMLRSFLSKVVDCGEEFSSSVQLREREIVASARLSTQVSLKKTGKALVEYLLKSKSPKFPALLLGIPETSIEMLLFDNGIVVIRGAISLSQARKAMVRISDRLKERRII